MRGTSTMRLDLADLQLFLGIVEAGSITQVVVRTRVSLAAASECLRKIEAGIISSAVQAPGLEVQNMVKDHLVLIVPVAHGVGLGLVPERTARRLRPRYGYRVLALNDAWTQRQLCLCFRAWRELSAPMRNLLSHVGADPDLWR